MLAEDFKAYSNYTGEKPIPAGFEEDYRNVLRGFHRMGYSGPLVAHMIPLLLKYGLAPPPEPPKAKPALDWRSVPQGTPVLVTLNDSTKKGHFQRVASYGDLEVTIGGDPWHHVVKNWLVVIDDESPHELTSQEKTAWVRDLKAEREQQQAQVAAEMADRVQPLIDDFPVLDPETVLDDDEDEPVVMQGEHWKGVTEGRHLIVEYGGDLPDARFVKFGPADGMITAQLADGEYVMVPETAATLA